MVHNYNYAPHRRWNAQAQGALPTVRALRICRFGINPGSAGCGGPLNEQARAIQSICFPDYP